MTLAEYKRRRGEPLEPEPDAHDAAHQEKHPGPLEYAQIGFILAVVTAVEVALYYIDMSHDLLVTVLIVLSLAKFTLVVLWFMHLKFDSRLFSVLFFGGMALTMSVFLVVVAVQHGKLV
jgi:cytochrome c oxidase subunit 4